MQLALKLREEKFNNEKDKDKKEMYKKSIDKLNSYLNSIKSHNSNSNDDKQRIELLLNAKDILSAWLDKEKGKEIIDNSIFEKVPRHYEALFNNDMAALNVILF